MEKMSSGGSNKAGKQYEHIGMKTLVTGFDPFGGENGGKRNERRKK